MADYVTITDAQVDPEAPITSELMSALRDNPIAIAEGAVGAPRIEPIAFSANYYTAGAVGTYVWARRTTGTGDVSFGTTLAGSSLSPTSAAYGSNAFNIVPGAFTIGSALSGTWRAMGTYDHELFIDLGEGIVMRLLGSTLWLRIS
jgi:hypothetical protein